MDVLAYLLLLGHAFGDKILAETYCNDLVDAFKMHLKSSNTYFNSSVLQRAFDAGLSDTPFVSLILKALVYLFMSSASKVEEGYWETELKEVYQDPSLMEAFLKEVCLYQRKNYSNPIRWGGCQFHYHKGGSKCEALASTATFAESD